MLNGTFLLHLRLDLLIYGGGSRNLVAGPHLNPHDPDCNVTLVTVYHALLSASLATWSPKMPLSVDSLIAFIRSVVDYLPSSSDKSPNVAAFGEILVDILWTIDSELDEILGDAKNVAGATEQSGSSPATVSQAVKAKENAEADKGTMVVLVQRLLVRGITSTLSRVSLNSTSSRRSVYSTLTYVGRDLT